MLRQVGKLFKDRMCLHAQALKPVGPRAGINWASSPYSKSRIIQLFFENTFWESHWCHLADYLCLGSFQWGERMCCMTGIVGSSVVLLKIASNRWTKKALLSHASVVMFSCVCVLPMTEDIDHIVYCRSAADTSCQRNNLSEAGFSFLFDIWSRLGSVSRFGLKRKWINNIIVFSPVDTT